MGWGGPSESLHQGKLDEARRYQLRGARGDRRQETGDRRQEKEERAGEKRVRRERSRRRACE
eukprot:407903-Hanusia_phi.AAC.1